MQTLPKYYLADIPHDLRTQVLDRCFRRLYHEGLDLLRQHGFYHYNRDDLINFYNWAPAHLPSAGPDTVDPNPPVPAFRDYDQPPAEQVEDYRKRLAELPPDLAERAHHALKHESIEQVGGLLWHAGVAFSSAELYDYRKTLFPPNSMVDPYVAGPPVLRPEPSAVLPAPEPSLTLAISRSPAPDQPGSAPSIPPAEPNSAEPSRPQLTADNGPLTANPPSANGDPAAPSSNPEPPPVPLPPVPDRFIARKRRGKIARLPKEIRDELNARLEANDSYETIVRWLTRKGHPGFNKQNLNLWKEGGYQDWRRENERIEAQVIQREWLNEQVAQTRPGELFLLIDQLFVTQLLDGLFGLDTATLKKGLAANPRHFIALFNAFNRFKRDGMNSDDFRAFLEREKRRKDRGKDGLSPEARRILGEMLGFPLPEPDRQDEETVKDSQG